MARLAYELLAIVSDREDGRTYRLEGFLAQQGRALDRRHQWLWRFGGAIARFSPRQRLPLLRLEFEVDEKAKRLAVRARGLLAPLMRPQTRRLKKLFERLHSPFAMRDGGFVFNLYQPPLPSTRFIHHICRVAVEGRHPPRPTTATLQVTTRCQLRCVHCSAARYKTRQREELSTAEWLDVIRQAVALGCYNIVFTGGEPLLRPELEDLIAAVDRERAHAALFTNGLLLTRERAAQLAAAGLYSIMISIDDPRPAVHDQLRGWAGAFQRATEAARQALEAGLLVGLSTYATPEDVRTGRVEQMIELARRLGVHEITIFDTVPTGRLLPLEQQFLLSSEDKQRLIALEREYNAREGYPHVITQAFINGPEGAGCFAAYAQFYMTAFGDVTPCDFTPLTFGNIRDFSLREIWERMLQHPVYQQRCDHCRMQDPEFRRQYIDPIPDDVLLPWPAFEDLRQQPHSPPAVACEVSESTLPAKTRSAPTKALEGDAVNAKTL